MQMTTKTKYHRTLFYLLNKYRSWDYFVNMVVMNLWKALLLLIVNHDDIPSLSTYSYNYSSRATFFSCRIENMVLGGRGGGCIENSTHNLIKVICIVKYLKFWSHFYLFITGSDFYLTEVGHVCRSFSICFLSFSLGTNKYSNF